MNPLLWNSSQLPNPAINPAINQFHRIRQHQLQQHSSIYLQQQRLQAQQKEELIRQKILLNNLLRTSNHIHNNSHSHFVSWIFKTLYRHQVARKIIDFLRRWHEVETTKLVNIAVHHALSILSHCVN